MIQINKMMFELSIDYEFKSNKDIYLNEKDKKTNSLSIEFQMIRFKPSKIFYLIINKRKI